MEFVRGAVRIERGENWESKYFWLGLAFTIVESLVGLYLLFIDELTHLDMTLLLFHILAGFPFVLPCIMFWRRHRRYVSIVDRPGYAWFGWSCVLSLVFAFISGAWLTFRGITGIRWLWLSHTVISLYGVAAMALYAFVTVRLWMGELDTKPSAQAYLRQSLWRIGARVGVGAVVLVAVSAAFSTLYEEPPVDRIVGGYSYPFGDDPFYPSRAQTASGGFYEPVHFLRSESCGISGCHVETLNQFKESAHYRTTTPAFDAVQSVFMEDARRGEFLGNRYAHRSGEERESHVGRESYRYCAGCHTPVALFAGEVTRGAGVANFERWEGDSCILCHRIVSTGDVGSGGGGDYSIAPPPNRYLFAFSDHPIGRWLNKTLINNKPEHHKAMFRTPLFETSEHCVGCHRRLQYAYWAASPYNHPPAGEERKECQDCHMAQVETSNDVSAYEKGTIANHRTLGSNVVTPILYGLEEQERLTREFMKDGHMVLDVVAPEAIRLGDELEFVVRVINKGVGHIFPAGPAADLIESWIEVIVTAGSGERLLTYGLLDRDGHLDRDSTHVYTVAPHDQKGRALELDRHRSWLFAEDRLHVVPAKYFDELPFSVDPAGHDAVGPFRIAVRLRFRKFNQAILDFAAEAELIPQIDAPVVELDTASASVELTDDPAIAERAARKWLAKLEGADDGALEGYTKKPDFNDYLIVKKLSLEGRIRLADAQVLYGEGRSDAALLILEDLFGDDPARRQWLDHLRSTATGTVGGDRSSITSFRHPPPPTSSPPSASSSGRSAAARQSPLP
ncbi:MAG: hypothetical protein CME06_02005 [Gemmatimonadetes bacterium]|nr:hypothetical protein [Gemmatimonadota bacterium]